MAGSVYTDFVIRDEYFQRQFIETLGQNVNAFNGASGGAIRLVTMEEQGHYAKTRFFDLPTDIVASRDISDISSSVTDKKLTQDELITVKVNRTLGPFAAAEDAFFKLGSSPEELSMLLGQRFAEQVTQDYLNVALNSLEAALSQESGVVYDYSGTGTIVHAAMITALSKFGDAANRIRLWVQHSKPNFDLMAANVTVASGNIAGMTLIDAQIASLNRPILVTDSSALRITGTPVDYVTLGLVEDAVVVTQSEPMRIYAERDLTKPNVIVRWRGEYAFNVGVRGYKWDTANGGINPSDAALATSSNWDKVVARDKDLPGVYLRTQ